MAASAPATTAIHSASLSGQRPQKSAAAAAPLTKTTPAASQTTAAAQIDVPASDTGSTLYNGSSSSSSSSSSSPDDQLTPFPPYHEREESIYENGDAVINDPDVLMSSDVDSEDLTPTLIPSEATFSPQAPRTAQPLAEPGGPAEPEPEPAEPTLPTLPTQPAEPDEPAEPAETAETAQTAEPAGPLAHLPAAVRKLLPPPYWTHSHSSDGTTSTTGLPSRAMASTSVATATATASTPAPATPPSLRAPPPYRIGALSLPVFRPPWSPAWPGGSRQSQSPSPSWHDDGAYTHDRDTSASSADFITLQDNDALPEDAAGPHGRDGDDAGWGAAKGGGGYRQAATAAVSAASAAASRCWAQRVDVTGFVVVGGRGGSTGGMLAGGGSSIGGGNTGSGMGTHSLGSFVVWTIRVQTLQGGAPLLVHKRYSEFDALRRRLVSSFPMSCAAAVPALPPKSVLNNFRPHFLEKRRLGLQYFLNCVLLNPEFSGSPVLKEFLFS